MENIVDLLGLQRNALIESFVPHQNFICKYLLTSSKRIVMYEEQMTHHRLVHLRFISKHLRWLHSKVTH